jgi:hypothetical protein
MLRFLLFESRKRKVGVRVYRIDDGLWLDPSDLSAGTWIAAPPVDLWVAKPIVSEYVDGPFPTKQPLNGHQVVEIPENPTWPASMDWIVAAYVGFGQDPSFLSDGLAPLEWPQLYQYRRPGPLEVQGQLYTTYRLEGTARSFP